MKYSQKMLLIPEEKYNRMINSKSPVPPPDSPPPTPEIQAPEDPSLKEEEVSVNCPNHLSRDIILCSLPKLYKAKASVLLDHIERNKDLEWNHWGELVYAQRVIPHSQIVDLLRECMREQTFTPAGSEEFFRALRESHVPLALISNQKRRDQLQGAPPPPVATKTPPPVASKSGKGTWLTF